jgi:hypothetical protein
VHMRGGVVVGGTYSSLQHSGACLAVPGRDIALDGRQLEGSVCADIRKQKPGATGALPRRGHWSPGQVIVACRGDAAQGAPTGTKGIGVKERKELCGGVGQRIVQQLKGKQALQSCYVLCMLVCVVVCLWVLLSLRHG